MKKNFKLIVFIFTIIFTIQSCKKEEKVKQNLDTSINPSNWPKELDAVIAAPKNHKILVENKLSTLETQISDL